MKLGLHYPNAQPGPQDLHIATLMQAECVKLLYTRGTRHSLDDLSNLQRVGVQHFCVRLRDSLYVSDDGRAYVPSDVDYAFDLAQDISLWYERGVRTFQIDNEPNLQHTRRAVGPYEYVWFMKRVISRLRRHLSEMGIPDVMLVSPPLSFSPMLWHIDENNPTEYTLDNWLGAYSWADPMERDADFRFPFYHYFDKLGANCYFQHPRQVRDPSFGACWSLLHMRMGQKRVVVLEVASSLHELTGPDGHPIYNYYEAEERRKVQYADWIYWTTLAGMVEECYFWIAPSCTIEWQGFAISATLAESLADEQGSMKRLGGGRFEI